ncbi:ASCH domain-containing protein [Microbacterium sp. YY-01]|uniref:ASCH domain-containing protein n=1 Tax=Microbacterium sp. YY-01 TaxID=3421634 RepID=UPI003D17CCA3
MSDSATVEAFWNQCRQHLPSLPSKAPEAWAFGATPEHADELLDLVMQGIKVATASSLWDYEAESEPLPRPGDLSVILDGSGQPRGVIETTAVTVVPFVEVTAEHAFAEGEGDRSLAHWRRVHEQFWRTHAVSPRGFAPDMPVVCETFRLLFPTDAPPRAAAMTL